MSCRQPETPCQDPRINIPKLDTFIKFGTYVFSMAGLFSAAAGTSPPQHDVPCRGLLVSASLENGLGNQLFQAANAFAYAKDIGAEAVFPHRNVEHVVGDSPVLSRLQRFEKPQPNLPIVYENGSPIPKDQPRSVFFQGNFQNPKYFDHRRQDLVELFSPTPEIRDQLQVKYKELLSKDTVAVHIRRGDYLNFKIGDDTVMYDLSEDVNYYEQALQNFDHQNQHFVIFSNDVEFAKNMPALKNLKHVTFIDKQKAHEDFYLMSMCKNHIIANSTFSWWAAYLGESPGKKVVMPVKWWHPDVAKKWNDPRAPYPYANYHILMKDWIKAGIGNEPVSQQIPPPADTPCSGLLVSANLVNGLGNQLFQAATAYAHAKDIDAEVVFPDRQIAHINGDSPVLSRLQRFTGPQPNLTVVHETGAVIPNDQPQSIVLEGLFQGPKYFHHRRQELVELFSPTPEMRDHLQMKHGDLLSKNTVAVHVRRGDYTSFKIGDDKIFYDLAKDTNYYEDALKEFGQDDRHFVVFSDDMEFTREMPAFKDLKNVTFIDGQKDHEDFYLMSMCKGHITSNSAFSWWAAYLGESPDKKVVMPTKWWHPDIAKKWNDPNAKYPHAHNGVLMDDWVKI